MVPREVPAGRAVLSTALAAAIDGHETVSRVHVWSDGDPAGQVAPPPLACPRGRAVLDEGDVVEPELLVGVVGDCAVPPPLQAEPQASTSTTAAVLVKS
jgi:hypothetical protein